MPPTTRAFRMVVPVALLALCADRLARRVTSPASRAGRRSSDEESRWSFRAPGPHCRATERRSWYDLQVGHPQGELKRGCASEGGSRPLFRDRAEVSELSTAIPIT